MVGKWMARPFVNGVMHALSNVGQGKWKHFWQCEFDYELFSDMNPDGNRLLAWHCNEK